MKNTSWLNHKIRFSKNICLAGLVALGVLLGFSGCGGESHDISKGISVGKVCTPDKPAEDLFAEVDPETQNDSEAGEFGRRILRRRGVRVNFDDFKRQARMRDGQAMRLELFNDRHLDLVVRNVQDLSEDNIIVTAQVAGDADSEATLVMRKGVLVGNIRKRATSEYFEIRSDGNDVHSVREIKESNEEDCLAFKDETSEGVGLEDEVSSIVQADPVIDILVAYTPNARIKQGGTEAILALIQMGIADTNTAFAESGIGLSVRLVGTLEVRQNESSFSSDLTALRSKTDGKWDEVHAERARLGADQVSMVGYYTGGVAGIGYISASAASAFTVTRTTAFGQYTFSHELGHNLGLQHSDGYENSSGRFRTIMAYGTYSRIRRYSNPKLTYKSYATSGGPQNSAAIVNSNAGRVSGLVAEMIAIPPIASTPVPAPEPEEGNTCDGAF